MEGCLSIRQFQSNLEYVVFNFKLCSVNKAYYHIFCDDAISVAFMTQEIEHFPL